MSPSNVTDVLFALGLRCVFFYVRSLEVDTGKSIEACAERNPELIMISVYFIHLSRLSFPKILPGIRESEVLNVVCFPSFDILMI
jgi:hypothetical protein